MKWHRILLAAAGLFIALAVLSFDFSIRFYMFFGRDENDRDLVNMVGFLLFVVFLTFAATAAVMATVLWPRYPTIDGKLHIFPR